MLCFAGGAKGARAFRANVGAGQLPSEESITYEGLFSEYYFDTGLEEATDLCQPSYAVAQAPNTMTGEVERWLALGLNSSEDGKNHREPLNLVIVLDISGSMRSPFGRRRGTSSEDSGTHDSGTKMEIANDVLQRIVKVLTNEERLGIVLFDTRTEILQPFRSLNLIDREDLDERIGNIRARGGTNMEVGYRAAMDMLTDHVSSGATGASNNRIIFITDAQPNSGGGPNTLVGLARRAAGNSIYTTFIGVGLDFNSTLVEGFSKVRGCNYFSVHSRKDFTQILNEDFNYITTPLMFNAVLFFESDGLEIDQVYGTPFADESTGALMTIDTLCASARDERGVKGGIVLLKLKEKLTPQLNPSQEIRLTLRYEMPDGERIQAVHSLDFQERVEECIGEGKIYETPGVRKAVLLAKFGMLMKETIQGAKNRSSQVAEDNRPRFTVMGVRRPRVTAPATASPSSPLSEAQIEDLKAFKTFYQAEAEVLEDRDLIKELDVLDRLIYMK